MTPARPGSDHGRGGQGGREPRATVQARALRVLDRSVAGRSQREIAAAEGLSQSAVSKILRRLETRRLAGTRPIGSRSRKRGSRCASIISTARASGRGRRARPDATRRVQRTTQAGAGGAGGATVAQLVVETQHGDPRYLEVARKVLADQRRVWGLGAPQKLDVRATEGPFDAMSDEALGRGTRAPAAAAGLARRGHGRAERGRRRGRG